MSKVRDGLGGLASRPSPLLRFVLVPGVVVMAGIVALASTSDANAPNDRMMAYALCGVMLLLAIGAWNPVRHRWALRAFATVVVVVCALYLVNALVRGSNAFEAMMACLTFGVPAAGFAITGRFVWWVRLPEDTTEL